MHLSKTDKLVTLLILDDARIREEFKGICSKANTFAFGKDLARGIEYAPTFAPISNIESSDLIVEKKYFKSSSSKLPRAMLWPTSSLAFTSIRVPRKST